MVDILPHPYFPKHYLQSIIQKFTAIDNALMLHYSTHSTDGLLVKILDKAAVMAEMRTKVSDVETILGIDPTIYTIYKHGDSYWQYDKIYVRFPQDLKGLMSLKRKSRLITALNNWISNNETTKIAPLLSIGDAIKRHEESVSVSSPSLNSGKLSSNPDSPSKITKPSPQKKLTLSNNNSKFRFIQRDEMVQAQKSGGLLLLERIKLKEKLLKEKVVETPEEKRDKFLLGKAPTVYDIIYHIQDNQKSINMSKLVQTTQDSLTYPLQKDEIEQVARIVAKKVPGLTLIKREDIEVIRVDKLDRQADLRALTEN